MRTRKQRRRDAVHEEMAKVPDLTKWPRLLVRGRSVTFEQAAEILVRTDSWWIMTNDKDWEQEIHAITGITQGANGMPDFASIEKFRDSIKAVSLNYLSNEWIESTWIGGPHGWVDWLGNVECWTWNIGKWPSVDDVYEDWRAIAEAWPFLHLVSQLIPEEGQGKAAVEFRVAQGTVQITANPETLIGVPQEETWGSIFTPGWERGCTAEDLKSAIEIAKRAIS